MYLPQTIASNMCTHCVLNRPVIIVRWAIDFSKKKILKCPHIIKEIVWDV